MPIYSIQAPDGKTYSIEGPEGASQIDIEDEVLRQNPQLSAPTSATDVSSPSTSIPTPTPTAIPTTGEPVAAPAPEQVSEGRFFDEGPMGVNKFEEDAAKVGSTLDQMLRDPKYSEEDIRGFVTNSPFPIDRLEPALEQRRQGGYTGGTVQVSPEFSKLVNPTPQAPMDIPEGGRGMGQRFSDAFNEASLYGFGGLAARLGHDWNDTGKPELERMFPGKDEDWYESMQSYMVQQALVNAREEAALRQESDPNWKPDESFLSATLAPQRWLPWLAGQIAGSGGPENFVMPAASIGRRMLIGAGTGLASEGAYQGAEVAQGIREDFDPEGMALNALTSGIGEGVLGNAGRVERSLDRVINRTPEVDIRLSQPIGLAPEAKATKAQRLTAAKSDIEERIGIITKDWSNAPAFEVVTNVKDIADPTIRAQAMKEGAQKNALGLLGEDGTVRIFAHNIRSPEDLTGVVYHEALGHHGLSQKFGDDLSRVLEDIYTNNVGEFKGKVDEWLEKYPKAYKNTNSRNLLAAEEVLAEMSQSGRIPVTIKDRVSNVVKGFARDMGMDLKYSDREINTILGMAHDATVKGRPDAISNGFRYSRAVNDNLSDDELINLRRSKSKAATAKLNETRPGTTQTLRPFENEEPDYWRFRHVTPEGKSVTGTYTIDNGALDNFSIDSEGGARSIGPSAIRKIGRDLLAEHPEATRISGFRISGARPSETFAQSGTRFMRADQTLGKSGAKAAIELEEELASGYNPVHRSWDTGKQALYDAGLSRALARKFKTVGQLDQAVFKYDNLAKETQQTLANAVDEFNAAGATPEVKAKVVEAIATHQYVLGRIFNLHSELGRGLAAIRAAEFSARDITRYNELLRESGGTTIGGLADDETFSRFMRQMQQTLSEDNPAGVNNLVTQVMKPYWWQYVLTSRHAAMLSGLGTSYKNIMDNAIIISRELGENMAASPTEGVARTYGLIRAALDGQTYLRTAKAFWDGHGTTPHSSKIEMQDARIPIVSKVNDFIHAQDTFFRSFHTNANLYTLGVRDAMAEGFKGKAALEEGSHRAANPTQAMLDKAKDLTDVALLVNKPPFSKGPEVWKSIRPGMDAWEQTEAFVAGFVFPFLRTSQNLIFQKLRRMGPLAFLDPVTWRELGEGGVPARTALLRIGYTSALLSYYWMSPEGETTQGKGPSDPKKLAALEAGGFMPNAVRGEDKYTDAYALNLSFNPFDTNNQIAADVASIRQAFRDGANKDTVADGLAVAVKTMLSILTSASYAENITTYTEPLKDGANDSTLANVSGGAISQFIPAFVRQYNYIYHDPLRRDTTGDKSVGDRVKGRIVSQIPGLSDTLPARHTVYGDTQERGKVLLGDRNYQDIRSDAVSKELSDLERSTEGVIVRGAPSTFTYEGEKIKLDAEGKQEWERRQGGYLRLGMTQTLPTSEWKSASKEEKIQIVKEIRQEAYDLAKDDMIQLLGLSVEAPTEEEEE